MDWAIHRPVEVESHPLVRKKYIIATPSIDQFFQSVMRCIRLRTPGAITYSLPRWGKTFAIKYSMNLIRQKYPRVPVYSVLCQKKSHPSESAFFSHLLESIGHSAALSGKIEAKRSRLVNKMEEAARRGGHDLALLFADEAQRLTLIEYEWLRDINDQLEQRSIRLITFLVGQHQLLAQKAAFRTAGQTQIVARFMIDEMQFQGLMTPSDFSTCLNSYDTSNFPENSDWNYTRYFFPMAYESGFRLLDHAAILWELFSAAHEKLRPGVGVDIPMQYFSRTVELALMENMTKDATNFELNALLWKQALTDSRFLQFQEELRLMQAYE